MNILKISGVGVKCRSKTSRFCRNVAFYSGTLLRPRNLIYIAILDIINAEMSRIDDRIAHFVRSSLLGDDDVAMPSQDTDRIFKFALIFAGLASMAAIGIWV